MKTSCKNAQINTWVPGARVQKSAREECIVNGGEIEHGPDIFGPARILIWLPILIFLGCVALCVRCCRNYEKDKVARAQRQRQQELERSNEIGP